MKFNANGLKKILDQYFPKLMTMANGNFVQVAEGVTIELPEDTEVTMTANSQTDGVTLDLPGGIHAHIDKNVGPFGLIHVNKDAMIRRVGVDAKGLDVTADGYSLIRLEAV